MGGTHANSLSPELTTAKPHHTDANQALTLLPKGKRQTRPEHDAEGHETVAVLAMPPTS